MRYRRPDDPQPSTADELFAETSTIETLKELLRACCPGTKAKRKAEMIAELVSRLQANTLPTVLSELSPIQRHAVAETAWSDDGQYDAALFEAKFGASPWPKQPQNDQPFSRFSDRTPILLDMIIAGGIMARDVQCRLRQLLPKPDRPQVQTVAAVPPSVAQISHVWDKAKGRYRSEEIQVVLEQREMNHAAPHDLRAVLRLIDSGKVSVSDKNHWPAPASMRHIVAVLDGGDFYAQPEGEGPGSSDETSDKYQAGPIRAFAWPLIVEVGGLAECRSGKLALTKTGREALTAPPHDVLQTLWHRWRRTDEQDELRRISVIRGQTGNGKRYLTSPVVRRDRIEDALRACPAGEWIGVDEFSRFIKAAGLQFEVTGDLWSLYLVEQQYGALAFDGHDQWAILQLRYILVLLMEYAATLGLVDVAFIPPAHARSDFGGMWGTDDLACISRYDGLMYFRINPLGAYCLGLTESFTPPSREQKALLDVMPSLTIRELAPLPVADRMLLESFAQPIDECQWRLDRGKTLEAIAAGRTTEELSQLLDASSDQPLPDRVVGFLAEANRHANAFSDVGGAHLFRCNDLDVLGTILRHPAVAKLCSRLDESHLVVLETNVKAFRKAMHVLGFALPCVS